jgi:sortase A
MTDQTNATLVRERAAPRRDVDAVARERPTDTAVLPSGGSAVASIIRRGLLIFAIAMIAFVLFCVSFSGLAHTRHQVGLQRRLRNDLASVRALIGGAIPAGTPVAILQIRRLGLNEAVVEGTRSGQLEQGPGHLIGTSLPGQPGNAVLAGRRTLYGAPFGHLGSLRPGDPIEVTTGQGKALYRVLTSGTTGATDGSIVSDRGDDRLTLVTANPALFATERLVVSAKLESEPFESTPLRRTLDPDGLGLTGERNAIATVLVWLEAIVALALLAVFSAQRWSRVSTWVVFVPGLLLTGWLLFENVVRLLPSTI